MTNRDAAEVIGSAVLAAMAIVAAVWLLGCSSADELRASDMGPGALDASVSPDGGASDLGAVPPDNGPAEDQGAPAACGILPAGCSTAADCCPGIGTQPECVFMGVGSFCVTSCTTDAQCGNFERGCCSNGQCAPGGFGSCP